MKIAFCTCVQLGKSCIEEVLRIGGHFDLFITLKDEQARQKSGRIYLDELAQRENTPLLKIRHINDPEVLEALAQYEIDWLFIIGWSQIAGEKVLAAPSQGIIGMHPTLLPLGRGRAAIPWAILKGLPETGVTMFKWMPVWIPATSLPRAEFPSMTQLQPPSFTSWWMRCM